MTEKAIPKRPESDAAVDDMLKHLPWSGELDRDAVDLLKDTRFELRCLQALVAKMPQRKTPQVAERLDTLRHEYREQLKDFGLDPAGRKNLGLSHGAAGIAARSRDSGDGLVLYRRPNNPRGMLRLLVETGTWDAVGAKIKAELAAGAEVKGGESEDTARKATRKRAGHRNGKSTQK